MAQATIQKITNISPIDGADKLEVLHILGWEIVAGKGEFKKGSLCIFVEIDSVVPEREEFEFLRARNFRVKTIKLRGQVSQGLALPLTLLPLDQVVEEGQDVTDVLGVTHYEKPLPTGKGGFLQGDTRCGWPAYLPHTDEPRLQSVPSILDELKGVEVYSSVKVDGTSATFSIFNQDIHVCSRNWSKKLDDEKSVYIQVFESTGLLAKLRKIGKNIAFQGEVCGPGIQKNRLGLKELHVFMFNVYFIDERRYADYQEFVNLCKAFYLETVPMLNVFPLEQTQDELLEMSKGKYAGTKTNREGIVLRTTKEQYCRATKGRASFKVVNNEYLLRED